MLLEGETRISQEIKYRAYEPGDEDGILELLDQVFKGWPKLETDPLKYWNWKYLENPLKINLTTLALSGEKVVGCYHGMPLYMKIGENVYTSSNNADLAVYPEYRGKGIYKAIRKLSVTLHSNDDVKFAYGVSNVPIIKADGKKRGDIDLQPTPILYVKIKDLALHKQHTEKSPLINQIGYHLIKTVNKYTRNKKINNNYTISKVDKFNHKIDEFYDNIAEYYNLLVKRDKEYMNWRYTHKDALEYQILQATSEGQIKGYGVYYINRYNQDYPVGHIVDLLHAPGEADASYEIMEKIDAYFEEEEVNIVKWQIPEGNNMAKVASDYHYLNSRSKNIMTIAQDRLNISEDDLKLLTESQPDKIHFVYGDFDWI